MGILHVTGINLWHVFTMKLSDRSVSSSSLENNCIKISGLEKLSDKHPLRSIPIDAVVIIGINGNTR